MRGVVLVWRRDFVGVWIDLESAKVDKAASVAGALCYAMDALAPVPVVSCLTATHLELPNDALVVLEAPTA